MKNINEPFYVGEGLMAEIVPAENSSRGQDHKISVFKKTDPLVRVDVNRGTFRNLSLSPLEDIAVWGKELLAKK